MIDLGTLIHDALERNASDIHLTVGEPPVFRLDGELTNFGEDPLTEADTTAYVQELITPGLLKEFQEMGEADFAVTYHDLVRMRCNVFRQRGMTSLALRLLPLRIATAEELGLPPVVVAQADKPRGLVLVTGPTGSGKSSTLAALLDHINHTERRHIITLEEPIEYLHTSDQCIINQREVGADICSSNKTGKYVQQGAPGGETETYQYNANGNSKVIPITAAKLHNAGGSYTETASASTGQTIPYCTCPTCDGGKWLKDFAAIIDSTDNKTTYHPTLQEAVKQFPQGSNGNTYIKMLHSTTEDISTENITTDKDLYLDLNGCTVKGNISVTGTHKLSGMDSSSKEYAAPSGKIVGTVTGTVAPTYQTPTVNEEYDRYVAIQGKEADGTKNLSFHHFNISVTGYRFELKAPQCALFFIGKFQGDEAAKDYLTSLGFTLKGEDGRQLGTDSSPIPENLEEIPDMPDDGKESTSEVVRTKDGAFLFEAYLMRSFDKGNRNGYTEKIKAIAQATFKNNDGTQDSEPKLWSFEDAWKNAGELDTAQQKILDNFLKALNIPNP